MLYFLILYIIFIVIFLIYSAMGIYHLWRFGYVGDFTKPVIIIYSVLAAAIIIFSLVLILTRQWPVDFTI